MATCATYCKPETKKMGDTTAATLVFVRYNYMLLCNLRCN